MSERRIDLVAAAILAARKYGIPEKLFVGLIETESAFNPEATGDRGKAVGIAQIWPGTAVEQGIRPEDRLDPIISLDAAARYLKKLYDKVGSWEKAIDAYKGVRFTPSQAEKVSKAGGEVMDWFKKAADFWKLATGGATQTVAREAAKKAYEKADEVSTTLLKAVAFWLVSITFIALGLWGMIHAG